MHREEADLERVLATVLFTDIVGSTEKAAYLGDRKWAELLQQHHRIVRGLLARYKGNEISTAGDGFFATFDGPARAVRCALATLDAVASLGIEVRAGVHTGEVETINGQPGGLAVNIGARIGALAGPSTLLASSTVKDLTAGSGLRFEDRGERQLEGVPGSWHIYAVRANQPPASRAWRLTHAHSFAAHRMQRFNRPRSPPRHPLRSAGPRAAWRW